jgi:hypothetical protein
MPRLLRSNNKIKNLLVVLLIAVVLLIIFVFVEIILHHSVVEKTKEVNTPSPSYPINSGNMNAPTKPQGSAAGNQAPTIPKDDHEPKYTHKHLDLTFDYPTLGMPEPGKLYNSTPVEPKDLPIFDA